MNGSLGQLDRPDERGAADRLVEPVRERSVRSRPLTLRRLLTLPFEDLLIAGTAPPAGRRISRLGLRACQALVLTGLDPLLVQDLAATLDGRDMRASQVILRAGDRFWPEAAAVLDRWLAQAPPGGQAAAEMRGIADLLSLGPIIVAALSTLPARPMGPLPPSALATIGGIVRAAAMRGPEAPLWALELLLARSRSPEVILTPLFGHEALGLLPRESRRLGAELARGRLAGVREMAAGSSIGCA